MSPLADRIRPTKLEDIVGQQHILGKGKILNRIISSKRITNMIFYGPPGVGKTTAANIAAKCADKTFYKLNATNASVKDIQNIIQELDTFMTRSGILLYLDEIQNFNKKQQQSLLEFMENGKITLISSTTENPYHYIYNAILSRSTVFEFKAIGEDDIIIALKRAINIVEKDFTNTQIKYDDEALKYLARSCSGDLRRALNALELSIYSTAPSADGSICISIDILQECTQVKALKYDKSGDNHYDILSAFQKSIRGSDPDAAIHYLARLVKAGDLISICRRLLVIAAEDIGLAYPNAVTIVKSCTDAAVQLGFPEARIPLAEAVILLATAPKSNSTINAIDSALSDLETKTVGDIPLHLKDAHYSGAKKLGRGVEYKYPHNYKNHYIKQQYLPDNIVNEKYYITQDNKMEKAIDSYIKFLKSEK